MVGFMDDIGSQVSCVMVSYDPRPVIIGKAIASIAGQVDKLYVVDNGTKNFPSDVVSLKSTFANVEFIYLAENIGIAAAQNIGIKRALEGNASFLMLSDQDSVYPEDYIEKMLPVFSGRRKVAAVAPNIVEVNQGRKSQGFIWFEGLFLRRMYPDGGEIEITQAIASGKIISADALKLIGGMCEALFIDWVDLEWCWRARKNGFSVIGNADVSIEHTLGDFVVRLGRRNYSIRSPLRHYYIIRNAVFLAFRSRSINLGMRVHLVCKAARYVIGFPVLSGGFFEHSRYCLIGLYHGLVGRLGRF